VPDVSEEDIEEWRESKCFGARTVQFVPCLSWRSGLFGRGVVPKLFLKSHENDPE